MREDYNRAGNGCLPIVVITLINAFLGGWSIFTISSWFDKSPSLIFAVLFGFFLGQFTIPIAIIGIFLRFIGLF